MRRWEWWEHVAFWPGLIAPVPIIAFACYPVAREILTIVAALWFLIGTVGVLSFRGNNFLLDRYGLHRHRTAAYLSSGPLLGQLERLSYTLAISAGMGEFVIAWLGIKVVSTWSQRKMEIGSHARALSLSMNLVNVLSSAFTAALVKWGAPSVNEFLQASVS